MEVIESQLIPLGPVTMGVSKQAKSHGRDNWAYS